MVSPSEFITRLQGLGIDFYAGVPDSLLKSLCAYIQDNIPANDNIIAANEGGAIALAAGHYLATGRPGAVYMQNSGIGNAVNPLLSLTDSDVYGIPLLLIIGWRGETWSKGRTSACEAGQDNTPTPRDYGHRVSGARHRHFDCPDATRTCCCLYGGNFAPLRTGSAQRYIRDI